MSSCLEDGQYASYELSSPKGLPLYFVRRDVARGSGMKRLLITITLLLLYTHALAGAPWTREDIWLESTWQVLHVVDWGQTRYISESPDYWEVNPILGRNPTRGRVDAFFVAVAALHWLISDSVGPGIRLRWQWISIGAKGGFVYHNWSLGVGVQF